MWSTDILRFDVESPCCRGDMIQYGHFQVEWVTQVTQVYRCLVIPDLGHVLTLHRQQCCFNSPWLNVATSSHAIFAIVIAYLPALDGSPLVTYCACSQLMLLMASISLSFSMNALLSLVATLISCQSLQYNPPSTCLQNFSCLCAYAMQHKFRCNPSAPHGLLWCFSRSPVPCNITYPPASLCSARLVATLFAPDLSAVAMQLHPFALHASSHLICFPLQCNPFTCSMHFIATPCMQSERYVLPVVVHYHLQ